MFISNNDILRRIRYTFQYTNAKMISLFALADFPVSEEQIRHWLARESESDFRECNDNQLAHFLDGFILEHRGPGAGRETETETYLNNNIILRKFKIALELKSEDIIQIMELVNFKISKHELSAFFRRPDHKHYRECKDQVLRNFFYGLQKKYRDDLSSKKK